MKRIVCITGIASQPRFIKRVQTLLLAGYDVTVYGHNREGYVGNALPEGVEYFDKGMQIDGQDYLSKIKDGYKDVKELTQKYKGQDVCFYSFSFLTAFWFYYRKANYIYEISDILYGYKRLGKIAPIMKWLDKKVIKRSKLAIMTSEGFKKYFFGDQPVSNVLVQPNKVNSNIHLETREAKLIGDEIKFSFIGAIRYFDTILRFAKVVGEKFPKHQFHFWGDSSFGKAFRDECSGYRNVVFHGKFKNPEDLNKIYSQTDVVVACYENTNLNEKIAEPNKMYEAILYCKPIIVQKDTFVAERVEEYRCGYAIDAYNDQEIEQFISNISRIEMKSISETDLIVETSKLLDNPDTIINRLKELD